MERGTGAPIISFCFSNSIIIFWICGRFICARGGRVASEVGGRVGRGARSRCAAAVRRPGVHTFLFIMPIAFVTPFMHCAICWLDDIVCSRSDTASMCDFILYIFLM